MKTMDRKEREYQERERRILNLARGMLLEEGYLKLNMDRIAEEMEYSKGTIYRHFGCKEEIILALANQTALKRCSMFEDAASWTGLPRERLWAIGYAAEWFVRRHPDHFFVEQILRTSAILEKTSEDRRRVMHSCELRCMGILSGVIRDGIVRGDLRLSEGVKPEQIVFGLWSSAYGGYSIAATSSSLVANGIDDPYATVRLTWHRLLDGYGFQPVSTKHDFDLLIPQFAERFDPKWTAARAEDLAA